LIDVRLKSASSGGPRKAAWLATLAVVQTIGLFSKESGAVLPGVEVTATQTATGITRTAVSDESGSYTLQSLPVGPYRLEAGLPGFRTFVQTGIVLQVDANPVINPVLEVGQVTETVEVRADASLVEMSSPCFVFGDLHGNYRDLINFQKASFPLGISLATAKILFLGDGY